jgi:hypothetical protein
MRIKIRRISGVCVLVVTMMAFVLVYSVSAVAQGFLFTKTATPSSGTAAPLTVTYTYTFDNTKGTHPLSSVATPSDDTCSPVVFRGGDSNNNTILDIGETWTWTCTAVVNVTTTNTSQTAANFTVCSGNTCSTTFLDFITARATVTLPPLSVTITGRKSVCKNDPATLTANATGGTPPYTFAWTNGATTQSITPNTSVPGTFPFGVTVRDHAGATATANATLTVALVCLTEVHSKDYSPDFPLLTTVEWGCGWSFAGRCLSRTIVKICVGGQCFDNPSVNTPPICTVCGWLIGVGGLVLGLGAGLLLARRRGGPPDLQPGRRPPA